MPGATGSGVTPGGRRNSLSGQGPLPKPLEDGKKTPATDQGRFWHTAEEGGCRKWGSAAEQARCQKRRGVYPFDSLLGGIHSEAVELGHPIQGAAAHPQEHGGLPLIARGLFQGQLDVALLHLLERRKDI